MLERSNVSIVWPIDSTHIAFEEFQWMDGKVRAVNPVVRTHNQIHQ